jgi:23S rRNA pseudouridine2605 synthase
MPRKTDNFSKFYNKKSNAAIKEGFRQEKKAEKKKRKEAIERHFEAKRQTRAQQFAAGAHLKKLPGKKKPPTLVLKATDSPAKGAPPKPTAPAAAPVPKGEVHTPKGTSPHDPNLLPLNKYIAHGGVCSRRDAAELIRQGKVQVNGKLVTEPGTKVAVSDLVKVDGKKVTISKNFVYILLNKPKDYITTTDDPQGRKTVLDLIRQATTERVFPVGRLDRNTSGVLLLTNDGDLAQKLAHPKHQIKKIYHVTLDKPLTKTDFDKIVEGVTLEDGLAHVDVLAYADAKDKTQIGLEIHSGRNRIVRRIFEHLGYDVRGLDRVTYAGLTKKNVQRGHWRLLTEKEIRILKYLNASFRGSLAAPANPAQPAASAGSDAIVKPEATVKPDATVKPAAPVRPIKPAKSFRPSRSTDHAKPTRPASQYKSKRSAKPATSPDPLRGRKSSGSYNKAKARDQRHETKRKRNSQ